MKKVLILITALVSLLSNAQVSKGGLPTSFKYKKQNIQLADDYIVKSISAPDLTALKTEDSESEKKGKAYRAAANLNASYKISTDGTWTNLPDGSKIWRLGIKVEDAKALGIYFSAPLKIPIGGKLHAYNASHSHFIGAYTDQTDGFTAMEMIQGDEITLEYFMPVGQLTLPTISIGQIAYFYRGVGDRIQRIEASRPVDSDRADACQVDVACSEITGWEPQRDAVVKYTFMLGQGTFLCSGAIMNNTGADCRPYVLTANHCGEPTSSTDIADHVWYFNYQRPMCEPGETSPYNGAQSQTMSGGFFRASSELGTHLATNNNQVSGSDFALLELTNTIPAAYNPYYAGWSKTTAASASGVGIHHPSGHEKKISTYTSSLSSDTYNGGWTGAHWEVFWAGTTNGHGVTEGGSSGSPIFNTSGKIVGHLSGGASFCTATNQSDLYGKFNKAWSQDGNNSNSQLKSWLDPSNSGVLDLEGSYSPCAGNVNPYCDASSVDCDEYIANVSLGGVANPTACNNYSLYWENNPLEISIGSSYILSITSAIIGDPNIGYTGDQISAWIDWNADGDFVDAGEQIYSHVIDSSSTTPMQSLITVPTSAEEGAEVRMRVRITYDVTTDGMISPCGISNYGEVEDYVVKIKPSELSINENGIIDLFVYPNPTTGLLTISLGNQSIVAESIEVFDMLGKRVLTESGSDTNTQLDLTDLRKGIYLISVKTEKTNYTQKIIIE